MRRALSLLVVASLVGAGVWYGVFARGPDVLVLTGIVTTHEVIVGPQVSGQITSLRVKEGENVAKGQLIAEIAPEELRADRTYFERSAEGLASEVRESEAALRYEERQSADEVRQAEARVEASLAQQREADSVLQNARTTLDRTRNLADNGVMSSQQLDDARAAFASAQARVESLAKQVDAQRAALALARAEAEQVTMRKSQVHVKESQRAAADAQRMKADVRLGYTQVRAPVTGIVDVRAAREGEVVNTGQPIVTLIDPDDLWVRVDIEETYIDRLRIGDSFTVRLPSGEERQGVVFYRRADASFATQRDVSRTKRDIRTFETRLRVDNTDRKLAVGMTVYVSLPVGQ
jgi:HlyD family secretion protein